MEGAKQSYIFFQRMEVTGCKLPKFRYSIEFPTGAALLKYDILCRQRRRRTRYVCQSRLKQIMFRRELGWYHDNSSLVLLSTRDFLFHRKFLRITYETKSPAGMRTLLQRQNVARMRRKSGAEYRFAIFFVLKGNYCVE